MRCWWATTARNNKAWNQLAVLLAQSSRRAIRKNLGAIDKETSDKSLVVIPGKVLGTGTIRKKELRICALGFSESARQKIHAAKCETVTLIDEMRDNPDAKGVSLLS